MGKMILAFMVVFGIIGASIIGFRHLNGIEKKLLTQIVFECIMYAVLAIVVLTGFVILF